MTAAPLSEDHPPVEWVAVRELLLAGLMAAQDSARLHCNTVEGEPSCLYLDDDLDPMGLCPAHATVGLIEDVLTSVAAALTAQGWQATKR